MKKRLIAAVLAAGLMTGSLTHTFSFKKALCGVASTASLAVAGVTTYMGLESYNDLSLMTMIPISKKSFIDAVDNARELGSEEIRKVIASQFKKLDEIAIARQKMYGLFVMAALSLAGAGYFAYKAFKTADNGSSNTAAKQQ